MNLSFHGATSASAIEGADPSPLFDLNAASAPASDADYPCHAHDEANTAQGFCHPGAATSPRLLSVQIRAPQDMRITIPCGANVGKTLRDALAPYHYSGAMGYICRGSARALQYHVIVAAAEGDRPYIYGAPIRESGEATFINGTVNFGRDANGAVLLHCHGGYADTNGALHGGHLILDETVVGAEPLVMHLCLFGQGGFVQGEDEETHYKLLQPYAGALQ
jgi:hypothetical protein